MIHQHDTVRCPGGRRRQGSSRYDIDRHIQVNAHGLIRIERRVNVIHTGALAAHADRASIGMAMPLSHTYEAPSFTSLTSKMGTQ